MDTDRRLKRILDASPELLEAVDALLEGRATPRAAAPLLLSITDGARYLGASRAMLYRLEKAGQIEFVRLLGGGRARVRRADLDRLVGGEP